MSFAVVVTPTAVTEVRWTDGKVSVEATNDTPQITHYLDRDFELQVGDEPPGPLCTASYSTIYRRPQNEFELLLAILKLPDQMPELRAKVFIHQT